MYLSVRTIIWKRNIADICILLFGYADWIKISDEFACQNHSSRSRSFSEGQDQSLRLWSLSRVVRFHLRWLYFLACVCKSVAHQCHHKNTVFAFCPILWANSTFRSVCIQVYLILLTQLAVTVAIICLFIFWFVFSSTHCEYQTHIDNVLLVIVAK